MNTRNSSTAVSTKKKGQYNRPKGKARKQAKKQQAGKSSSMVLGGLESKKAAKGDPRIGMSSKPLSVGVSTSQKTIPIQVELAATSIYNFAMGYVTRAFEKGYFALASSNNNPYYAYSYLYSVLLQFAAGGVPGVQQLPYVVLAFGRALSPKSVGMDNGRASFSFLTGASSPPPLPVQSIGFPGYGFQWSSGYVPSAPTFANGFPLLSLAGLAAPTDAQGASAFAEMNSFLQNNDPSNEAFRSVNISSTTVLDRDVSTFSVISKTVGLGTSGTGTSGFGGLASLEVPIFRPYLATFNQYSTTFASLTNNRWGNVNVDIAGDSTWLGATMGTYIPESHWGFQRYPKFHAVDFMEFGEVLAMWVQGIQQASMSDPGGQFANTEATPALTIQSYQCPLTLQEVLLLLRNVMMTAFKDTQAGVQGISPYVPSSATDNQFVPYVCGSGSCFLQAIDMKLPRGMVENILALSARCTHRTSRDIELFVPVLGQYALDVLSSSNFSYEGGISGSPPIVTPSFASGALYKKKFLNEETEQWEYRPMVEEAISLVDGSCTSGMAAINNPMQLKHLTMMWNKWLGEGGLTSFSSTLATLGSETGVNILCSINATRHWTVPAPDAMKNKVEGKYVDTRMEKKKYKSVTLSNYDSRLAIADTFQSAVIATAYEKVQSVWILPVIENEFVASTDQINSSLVPRWQSIMRETHLQGASSGFDGEAMSSIHQSYANKMVKSRQDAPNDWDLFFNECDSKGEGGILSGLVGGALTALFPKAGPIISAVASVVPF